MDDLFSTSPAAPLPAPLRIAPQHNQPTLSKAQKAFNTLVKKIETSRETLAQWQGTMQAYQRKVASDFAPLLQTYESLQADMVFAMDKALDAHAVKSGKGAPKGLTKTERRVVQELICELAENLIVATGDDTLKAVYNKHNDIDFDAEEAQAAQSMKAVMQGMFGVDLDADEAGDKGDGVQSPQDVIRKLQEQMKKMWQQESEESSPSSSPKNPPKRKTAKQLAREEKQKTEADQTSQSIREVYRKLVSALHPDREPDPTERIRKTALMQRVNQAYDKKDLLQLLELQLELEHIDAQTIAGLSEDRLKHFNKVLKEQLAELEQEIASMEMPLHGQFNLQPYMRLQPNGVMPLLLRDIAALQRDIRQFKKELLIPHDLAAFKLWIKARKQEARQREAEMDDEDFPF
jgi:hypothetical protein